jgi:hypothetical protein
LDSVGSIAGQRRRKQAVVIGKERRDAVVRAKRMRRADDSIGDEGMLESEESSMSKEEASGEALDKDTILAVEDLKSAFSARYSNLTSSNSGVSYTYMYPCF